MESAAKPSRALSGIDPDRLRTILDGLTDAAVVVDRDLRPLAWNSQYASVTGLSARRLAKEAEMPTARCRDLYGLEVCDTNCLVKQSFSTGQSVHVHEIRGESARKGDAAEPSVLIVSTIPVKDDQGEVQAVLEVYRDVTAEARIQARYKVLLENERKRAELLEAEVRARTADLQASLDELRQTRAQLIQSDKLSSLGRLVAGIAHEINNPVNFIYGNLDFLESHIAVLLKVVRAHEEISLSPEDLEKIRQVKAASEFEYVCEDLGKLVKSIRVGAERVTGIVRDLRAVCHQAGDKMGPVSLPECIDRSLNLLTHNTKGRVEIVKHYDPNVPEVFGNEGRLSQVFMNLLVNAVQAIPKKGKIEISIREANGGAAVDIADNGPGIPEDIQLKIFDPFFTTKPPGDGMGLGLTIAHTIINAHNGKISLKSKVGEGTVFTLELPLAKGGAKHRGAESALQ